MSGIESMLVIEAQNGRANELACGLMAMGITASVLFLRGATDAAISAADQTHGVNQGIMVKAKAEESGRLAAGMILCKEADPEETKAIAGAVACMIVAHTSLVMMARACGVDPYRVLPMVEKLSDHVADGVAWQAKRET